MILISAFVGVIGTIGFNRMMNPKTTNEVKDAPTTSLNSEQKLGDESKAEVVSLKQRQANINITQVNADNFPLIKGNNKLTT